MPARKKIPNLKSIRRAVILACRKDPAYRKTVPVFGEGPCPCEIMIVGEAPGRKETELGRPFVGRAGAFFTAFFEKAFKKHRQELYITNVVKVWPRINTLRGRTRPPTKEEEAFFLPYLKREIEAVRPKVVVTVGRTAFNALSPGSEFRPGEWVKGPFDFSIMPVYHPAYILRNQHRFEELTGDMKKALVKVKRRLRD